MIRSYGVGPDPGFETHLENVERHAASAVTSTGFDYMVGDPELMGGPSSVLGKIVETPDLIEVELVVGEDIAEPYRDAVARICFDSAGDHDRYAIARAANSIAKEFEAEKLAGFTDHLQVNLEAHARGIRWMDSKGLFRTTHPLTRETVGSSLGWLSLVRPLREQGLANLDNLASRSLDIPPFDSDMRLAGLMKTKRGWQSVGIVSAIEKSEKHTCPCCQAQILRGSSRITLSTDQSRGRFDHHHYHFTCFAEKTLGKVDIDSLRLEPNPYALNLGRTK